MKGRDSGFGIRDWRGRARASARESIPVLRRSESPIPNPESLLS